MKVLDLLPKIEEGLLVDAGEREIYKAYGWDLRPELEGKGDAEIISIHKAVDPKR